MRKIFNYVFSREVEDYQAWCVAEGHEPYPYDNNASGHIYALTAVYEQRLGELLKASREFMEQTTVENRGRLRRALAAIEAGL